MSPETVHLPVAPKRSGVTTPKKFRMLSAIDDNALMSPLKTPTRRQAKSPHTPTTSVEKSVKSSLNFPFETFGNVLSSPTSQGTAQTQRAHSQETCRSEKSDYGFDQLSGAEKQAAPEIKIKIEEPARVRRKRRLSGGSSSAVRVLYRLQ